MMNLSKNSLFITVEGGEYVGKTSLVVPSLAEIFKRSGFKTLASREPGGTEEAEKMRTQIFERARQNAPIEELTLFFNKARKIHLEESIIPFITESNDKPHVVILDRYLDSTRVYQGLEGGLDMNTIFELEKEYVGDYFPNFTFILYIPEHDFDRIISYRQSLEGSAVRDQTSFDEGDLALHIQRQRYHMQLPEIAKERGESRKFFSIDASQHPVSVVKNCMIHIMEEVPQLEAAKVEKIVTEMQQEGYWDEIIEHFDKQRFDIFK